MIMKQQELYEDLVLKMETPFSDESVPAEYLDIIEDTPDLETDLPDNYYNDIKTPYFNFEERQFIDENLYGWVIEELINIQYLYEEDQKIRAEYDRKIHVTKKVSEVLTPIEIIAFDSCLGGNEVCYGGWEALNSVQRCAGNGNGLSGYGIEIIDFDDFHNRLYSLGDILDELIDIIDDSTFLRQIGRGKLHMLMKEIVLEHDEG
jgi:hypothetical protein